MTASTTGSDSESGGGSGSTTADEQKIKEVWASNLEEEFQAIRDLVETHPIVAMDTEFPGVVARPIGEFKSREDYQYQLLRCNVDLLRLIQVGLSFYDREGRLSEPTCTWQFNFKFSLSDDMFAQDSVELLQNSGIDFRRLGSEGIDVGLFAELLITSGLVLSPDVTWLSFHSGYDFGYLMKLLTNNKLPKEQKDFSHLLGLFFPNIYDIKNVIQHMSGQAQATLSGGLQEIADTLGVERVGRSHQAGSDSLLTGSTFFQIKIRFFNDSWESVSQFRQALFGLSAVVSDLRQPAAGAPSGGKENRAPSPLRAASSASLAPGPALYEAPDTAHAGIISGANAVNAPPGLDGGEERQRESSSDASSSAESSEDSQEDKASA